MQTSPVSQIVKQIMQITNPDNKRGAEHAGNWPVSAQFGVNYTFHDKQFPNVSHERSTVYFDDASAFEKWLEEKRDWIKGTDYDFSMTYSVYEWNLGPIFIDARFM